MRGGPGRARKRQNVEGSKDTLVVAPKADSGDAGEADPEVTMRGGGDNSTPRSRYLHKRIADQQAKSLQFTAPSSGSTTLETPRPAASNSKAVASSQSQGQGAPTSQQPSSKPHG
ncbi:hypothetical protein H0G86_009596 [Trichoderma simmonsii]|uniref:Uncharacterized protein n=1 Tax=Trichoderma simmonsii TaxID=1491479 RepID=A0A8G0PJ87_9HYPO|nr:hypothetical protein H0G86_009596 [Trichoderma simmonsii]